jgi:hypothetical protein
MTAPTGPDLLLSILPLDPSPAFSQVEAEEIRSAIGPDPSEDERLEALALDNSLLKRVNAKLQADRDQQIRIKNSLVWLLIVQGFVIPMAWAVGKWGWR